jgi:hypothetical protein
MYRRGSDIRVQWAELFDRADEHETDVATVREALAARRETES